MSLSLPQYQWPQWSQINQEVAVRVKAFIRRSARLIILFSGLVGFLANINYYGVVCPPQLSILADMGRLIAPYFGFMGLGEQVWQPVVALIAGVVAKEVILTTLNSLYHVSDLAHVGVFEQIYDAVVNFSYKILGLVGLVEMPSVELVNQMAFSKQAALAYMVFVLLYFPCISTLVVLYKECGVRWAMASFMITSVLSAWAAKVVYTGFGVETLCLLAMMILAIVIRRGYDTFRNQNVVYKEAISDINSNY
jgi:ferrous iron transport protein B